MMDAINLLDYIFGLLARCGKLTLVSLGDGDAPIYAERKLRQYGVRLWGRHIIGSEGFAYVRSGQAKWANYLIRGGSPKRAWQKGGVRPRTLVDYVIRIVEGIFRIQ